MRTLYYLKTTLKSMRSGMFMLVSSFILFPILLACFMGFLHDTTNENPLKLRSTTIQIVDEDNSQMSKNLIEMLKSEEMADLLEISEENADFNLNIEEGYEKSILSLEEGKITINKNIKDRDLTTETIKVILDSYHKNLYAAISNGEVTDLNKILNSEIIENITIDKADTNNIYEEMATSMIGFVISMLIFNFIQTSYADVSVNLDKRVSSLPITKLQMLFYDSVSMLIYSGIIVFSYVMFFRITKLGFKGDLVSLFGLVLVSALVVVSVAKCISTIFGSTYGKVFGYIIFGLIFVGGETFGMEANKISLMLPTHYIGDAFKLYNLNGSLENCGKLILSVVICSIVMYFAAVIKVLLDRRIKNAVNKINFNKHKKTT